MQNKIAQIVIVVVGCAYSPYSDHRLDKFQHEHGSSCGKEQEIENEVTHFLGYSKENAELPRLSK